MIFEHIAPYITPIINCLGVINLIILAWAFVEINKLSKHVHPSNYYDFQGCEPVDGNTLVRLSDTAAFSYTFYANITSIFPLLGIFGTVCSLVDLSSTGDISANFATALDTTIFGLIWAMFFKVLDSLISSKLDRALDEADYRIHKLTQKEEKSHATQTETGHRH